MTGLFDVLVGDDSPPGHVLVDGGLYPILTDFRHWMRVESTLFDAQASDAHKMTLFLHAFAPSIAAGLIDPAQGYPFPLKSGIAALQAFRMGGEAAPAEASPAEASPAEASPAPPRRKRRERAYDFRHDIGLIYAAFRSAYHMDLMTQGDLHWWVFLALFAGLPEGEMLRGLMRMRAEAFDKPTRAQRALKAAVALPERLRWAVPASGRGGDVDEWARRIRLRRAAGKGTTAPTKEAPHG